MNRLSLFAFFFVLTTSLITGQGTTVIQTPFGPREVPAQQAPQQQTPVGVPAGQTPPAAPGNVAAQPTPQAGAANPAQDNAAPFNLRVVNGDVRQVIQIIGEALKLNYIIDPAIRGTVDINTSETLRVGDLLPILESILKINGATMIRTGNFYQIVPANTAARQPIEVTDQQPAVSPDDQVVMQIIRMKFVAASEMSRMLTQFLTDAGSIVVHDTGNVMLVTDRRSNIRKLLQIIDEFDTAVFRGQRVRLLPVKSTNARDLVDDLRTIFTGYALSEKDSAIRFIVLDRLNSILVVAPNVEVFPEIERWLATLDQPVATAGVRTFVYNVKNAKAGDLQKVLSDLYGQTALLQTSDAGSQAGFQNTTPNVLPAAGGAAQTPPPPAVPPQQQAGQPTARAVLQPALGGIRIIAHETNNALVIQATPQQYADIVRTLEELDVLRRQVLIDAQVYEVVLGDNLAFGISAQLQNRDMAAIRQTTGNIAKPLGIDANTFAFIGRTRELLLFLNASENRSRIKTLSAPSVLVTDNGVAQFQVGTEVPIPTSSTASGVQSGGSTLFAQTIQFRNTGVILQVRPQINQSGNVTLDIAQEISQAGANNVSSLTTAPVIGKSAVSSQIVVEDGQTIAIGGFIRESNELTRNRVPLVGKVPGLGVLFGTTNKNNNRSELIVLITPHVLRTHDDADLATDELKAKLKEMKGLLQ